MGNPATDKAVKAYLRVVTMEQLKARVQPNKRHFSLLTNWIGW